MGKGDVPGSHPKQETHMNEQEIPNHWKGKCFGCSRLNEQGLKLRFWSTEKGCKTRCIVPGHLCGIDGIVHGGILTLIMEEVAQWTIINHLAKFGMTREVAVRYLKPVPTGKEIFVEAEIVDLKEKDIRLRCTVRDSAGVLMTEGESQWILASPSTIAKATTVDESVLREFLSKYSRQ